MAGLTGSRVPGYTNAKVTLKDDVLDQISRFFFSSRSWTLRIFFSFNVIMSLMSSCKKTLFRIFRVKITCCCCTLSGRKKMEIYSVAFSGHLFLHLLPREEHGPLCFPRILLCQFDPEKAPECTTKWMKSFLMKRL